MFVLGAEREPDVPEDTSHPRHQQHPLRSQLIERCNHLSDEVSQDPAGEASASLVPFLGLLRTSFIPPPEAESKAVSLALEAGQLC